MRKTSNDFYSQTNEKGFIFEDQSKFRWPLLKLVFILAFLLLVLLLFVVGLSEYYNPVLPSWSIKGINQFSTIHPLTMENGKNSSPNTQSNPIMLQQKIPNNTDVYAFYVNWDRNSLKSFYQNMNHIHVLIPEWYSLSPNLGLNSDIQKDVGSLAKKHHVQVTPLINNFVNGVWNSDVIDRFLNSPDAQSALITNLQEQLKSNGYDGINIDFEFLKNSDRDLLTAFMQRLYSSFHKENLSVTIDVPPSDHAYDYDNLEKVCDRMIFMLYDENDDLTAGPISSQNWYQENLSKAVKDKLIVSLGNYGYDWDMETKQPGKDLSFQEIMRFAAKANVNIQWDNESQNPYLLYETNNHAHQLWFLDSATFYNQWKTALSSGVKGVAIWRLGTEDPGIWNVVKGANANTLTTIKNGDITYNDGVGNILRAGNDQQQDGKRSLGFNDSGFITSESYVSPPKATEIERLIQPSTKNEVALTFDDGPDPTYTKKILEILREKHIHATFFVIGKNALNHQDLVKQEYNDGNEIGNHSFSHPDMNKVSDQQLKWELDSNQRMIQAITGRSSLLFRYPYGEVEMNMYGENTENPYVKSEFQRMMNITQMGYITVNYDVDSEDWKFHSKKDIATNVVNQLQQSKGHIILLHDGGGDRSATVQALPKMIDDLKKKGYTFVTTSELMNTNRDTVMPAIPSVEKPLVQGDKVVLAGASLLKNASLLVIYGFVFVFLLRLLLFSHLALRHKKRSGFQAFGNENTPFVSVVIAAYNEEKVICNTIQSILLSTYENFEIIVVDDGSTDKTSLLVKKNFPNLDQLHLMQKKNGGKASALNVGIRNAKGTIIVTIDADTIISPEAISLLVRHFSDEKVAAVAGNVKVGNLQNLLTTWQHIEYVTGFNLEKRAYAMLNCVTIVPGAIGAWRKQAIERLGYFTYDTLAEDTDLTLQILSAGYKVAIEEQAIAYSEAPENSRSFLKQRFRWNFGTLQCFWKHKKAMIWHPNKSLSMVALPNILLFQFIVPLMAPLMDMLMVLGLFTGNFNKALIYYAGYFLGDLCISVFAFKLEKAKLPSLLSLFLQRIFYRYLLLWVLWKSIFTAMKGIRVGWGKLERTGNIEFDRKTG